MTEQIKDLEDCTPEELEWMYETYKLSFDYYELPFNEAKQRALIDSLLVAPWFHGFVHITDQSASGFLFFIDSYSSVCGAGKIRIEEIFVVEARRNSGIGRKLLDCAIDYGRKRGVGMVELNTEANNAEMLRFYERAGFQAMPHTPLQLKVDLSD